MLGLFAFVFNLSVIAFNFYLGITQPDLSTYDLNLFLAGILIGLNVMVLVDKLARR